MAESGELRKTRRVIVSSPNNSIRDVAEIMSRVVPSAFSPRKQRW
jgi:hypothetical protein